MCKNLKNWSNLWLSSIIHTHSYMEIDTQNQSHWYFTSIIQTHLYAEIYRAKVIDILQVSFLYIHMCRCTEPKSLIFYKYHSYKFICVDTREPNPLMFYKHHHTHSYAETYRAKAIDILQVSFIHIHTYSYADINRINATDKCHSYTFICIDTQNQTHCILQVSFIHIHMWRCTQAKPLLFCTCHSYKFICRGHRAESLIFYKCHSYTYVEMHTSKAIAILHVSFIQIHMQRS